MFEHFYIICLYRYFHRKKKLRVNLVSAFDLPLVQAGMHGLYTGHITHGTRFGMKYYAKNVVPVFCVSCASVSCAELDILFWHMRSRCLKMKWQHIICS